MFPTLYTHRNDAPPHTLRGPDTRPATWTLYPATCDLYPATCVLCTCNLYTATCDLCTCNPRETTCGPLPIASGAPIDTRKPLPTAPGTPIVTRAHVLTPEKPIPGPESPT